MRFPGVGQSAYPAGPAAAPRVTRTEPVTCLTSLRPPRVWMVAALGAFYYLIIPPAPHGGRRGARGSGAAPDPDRGRFAFRGHYRGGGPASRTRTRSAAVRFDRRGPAHRLPCSLGEVASCGRDNASTQRRKG
jgi:hypothetical protein